MLGMVISLVIRLGQVLILYMRKQAQRGQMTCSRLNSLLVTRQERARVSLLLLQVVYPLWTPKSYSFGGIPAFPLSLAWKVR